MDERDRMRTGLSRRQFLRVSGGAAGLAAAGAVGLSACGSSPKSSPTTSAPSSGQPKRGGNLKVGLTGGASTDTLDPDVTVTVPDIARQVTLFEPLVTQNAKDRPALDLAKELTPDNPHATSWTIRLQQGVTFHNGKELTAEDVLFTFTRILNPKKPLNGALSLSAVDLKNVKILDKHTLRVPMNRPYATFPAQLYGGYDFIVPVGFDPKAPVARGRSSSSRGRRESRASSSATRTIGRGPFPTSTSSPSSSSPIRPRRPTPSRAASWTPSATSL